MDQNYKAWAYLGQIPLSEIKDNKDMVMQRVFYNYYNNDMEQLGSLFEAFKEQMENDDSWKALKIAKSILIDLDLKTDLMSPDELVHQIRKLAKDFVFL